jgi:nucleotide-binding universal stress UspA family protein
MVRSTAFAQAVGTMCSSIVCGIDEGPAGRAAASQAACLARALGGRVVLVPNPDPAALLAVAEREAAELIVVPAVYASALDALMSDAPCPVLFVRTRRLAAAA